MLAQYTQDKNEFLLVKVEEKGKTEQNNTVVSVLPEYEPNNNKLYSKLLQPQQIVVAHADTNGAAPKVNPAAVNNTNATASHVVVAEGAHETSNAEQNVVVVTYDDLKTTFDVFLQVLLSQYLNGEFLLRIKQIQDEYFKPSIEFIETILNEKYTLINNYLNEFIFYLNSKLNTKLINVKLKPLFKDIFEKRPRMVLLNENELNQANLHINNTAKCESFVYESTSGVGGALFSSQDLDLEHINKLLESRCLVKFSGSLYNSDTLLPLVNTNQNDDFDDKQQFFICSKVFNLIKLMHSLRHFKINYYEICSKKVRLDFVCFKFKFCGLFYFYFYFFFRLNLLK